MNYYTFQKLLGTRAYARDKIKYIKSLKLKEENEIQLITDVINSTSAFKIMQRLLAGVLILVFIGMLISSFFIDLPKNSLFDTFGYIVLSITATYFTGGVLNSLKK